MPLRQPESPGGEAAAPPATTRDDAVRAAAQAHGDRETIKPYKLRWDLERPTVSVGVADDGTFLSNVGLSFSDLLGDHRASLTFFSVSTYSNFIVSYTSIKHRLNWGATVFDLRDYYLSSDGFNLDRRQAQKNTGAQVFASYPFSRYYRAQAALGFTDSTQDLFAGYATNGTPLFQETNDQFIFVSPSIIGDTTRFQSFGPFQGKRFEFGMDYGLNLSSNIADGNVEQYKVDFRAYKQLTGRSLLAFRFFGVLNEGERRSSTAWAALNDLRGYEYRDFYGSNVVQGNVELRFPFVDEVRFPIGPSPQHPRLLLHGPRHRVAARRPVLRSRPERGARTARRTRSGNVSFRNIPSTSTTARTTGSRTCAARTAPGSSSSSWAGSSSTGRGRSACRTRGSWTTRPRRSSSISSRSRRTSAGSGTSSTSSSTGRAQRASRTANHADAIPTEAPIATTARDGASGSGRPTRSSVRPPPPA
jgi:hypothetical protein